MKKIKIQCPAKINLTLKVTGERPDGFHDIESVMQTISLYDYLTITLKKSDRLIVQLSGTSDEIPYDERNLVYKAAKLFFENVWDKFLDPLPPCGRGGRKEKSGRGGKREKRTRESYNMYSVSVFIEKNIPAAAGLAGGSSDAAGMLYGLNKLLDEPYDTKELHELCAKLGSDLNFCLAGGRQRTSGRGEILTPLPFEKFSLSVIKPVNLGISAKEAYTKFSRKLESGEINNGNYVNDLEWAVISDFPELQKIKLLYPQSVMSGSGSTFYIINNKFKPVKGCLIINGLEAVPDGVTEV